MASVPTPPSDSSNRVLQDRFNQDMVSALKTALTLIASLEARIEVLEP